MFLIRKIGSILRGAATPLQVMLACVLGSLIGFSPGFLRAPALVVTLIALLLVLNANVLIALFVGGLAKLASLALMGLTFAVGRFLLDGPAQGLFASLVNAPFFAYFGLEWYVGAGGLLVGLLFGVAAGFALNVPLKLFRAGMAKVEDRSSAYSRWKDNCFFRLFFFIVFGPRHKNESYGDLLERSRGSPIRVAGVAVGFGWFVEPSLGSQLRAGLQAANGATVDLGALELDLGDNRLSIRDLALCDPEALEENLFQAALLECDLSGADLLRKRFKIDRIVVSDALHGAYRATPGQRTRPPEEPVQSPEDPSFGGKDLDEWLATAKEWKGRLEQLKGWLERMKREPAPDAEETLEERLEREVEARGWRNVAATHLIEGAPTFLVGEIRVEGMRSDKLEGRPLDLVIENLSSDPGLVDAPITVSLKSRDGYVAFALGLASEARTPGESFLDLRCAGVATDPFMDQVEAKTGARPLRGGTLDAGLRLAWHAGGVAAFDSPLAVTVRDTTMDLPQIGAATLKELAIPLLVRGPLEDPSVKVETGKLADNLAAAGAGALADALKSEAQRRAGELEAKARAELDAKTDELEGQLTEKVGEAVGEAVGEGAKKALEGLNPFGRKKDDKKDEKKSDGSPR
jgi:uncharacterized protein (TIGR03546 family)